MFRQVSGSDGRRWWRMFGERRQFGIIGQPVAGDLSDGDLAALGYRSHDLSRLNEFLLERTRGEKYATIFYCLLSRSGVLSYTNAGHCAPFLVSRDGRLRKLHTSGIAGRNDRGCPVPSGRKRQLEPGDKLVIYSDGLTEGENAEGEFFDTERLRVCSARLRFFRCGGFALGAAGCGGSLHRGRGGGGTTSRRLVLEYSPE